MVRVHSEYGSGLSAEQVVIINDALLADLRALAEDEAGTENGAEAEAG